jgi:hypothetical protein
MEVKMSGKIVQLTFPGFPGENNIEDSIKSMLRGLFARDSARKKEIEKLLIRNMELEEVVFRMSSKIDRITQGSFTDV